MSINVTVSGNPVRINRGKMVTAYDPAKTEFEKRRLMRLEQVRQQSKDIAENVRNRFKKEKTKCLSEIEKDGEVKLKNWQARKLLELQNQYQDALEEIGLGHKDAARLENEEQILVEQQESNERLAKERGRAAAERLQIERNEESLRKAVPVQRKKMTRDMENTRSDEVARKNKIGKSPSKKMKKGKQFFDSDEENKVPLLTGLGGESEEEFLGNSEGVERQATQVLRTTKEQQTSAKVSREQQTSALFQASTSDKAAQTTPQEGTIHVGPTEFNFDTRISERIKRRAKLNPEIDYCDYVEATKTPFCTCCRCPAAHQYNENLRTGVRGFENKEGPQTSDTPLKVDKNEPTKKFDIVTIGPETFIPGKSQDENNVRQKTSEEKLTGELPENTEMSIQADKNLNKKSSAARVRQQFDVTKVDKKADPKSKSTIPSKPRVTLKSTKHRPAYISTSGVAQPVQYYDHPNRYTKSYLPKSSHVEKIDDEELVISPNLLSEEEIREKMRQRDLEAHLRGQLALEKEKIQREYRELMRKLPALQKQERICEIGMDKEKYHMSKDRLEDLEKRRQNRLDNAYEELFVRERPAVVTLPKRENAREEEQSLNLGSWDIDFDSQDVSAKSRCETLNNLLTNLKTQKDSLLKEIASTLSQEALTQFTKDSIDDVKSKSTDYTRTKSKRKRSRDERPPSPTSSEVNLEITKERTKSSKKGATISTTATSSPSPRKKAKLKSSSRKVLILQNSSTQTTPKTDFQSAATSPVVNTPVTDVDTCTCNKESLEDLCEIVIKIKDDEKPEIKVNPPFLGKSVRVVTEDETERKEAELGKQGSRPPTKGAESLRTGALKEAEADRYAHKSPSKEVEPGKGESMEEFGKKVGPWKSQLSHSTSSQSTSSTSYRDHPNTFRSDRSKRASTKQKSREVEEILQSMNSTASSVSGKQMDPRLLTYIKKLLNMSRASIDDLTVSTASEVSTPSHSVVETPTNNPLLQLKSVMKYFNLDVADLQKQLSYTSDESSRHYNTRESVAVSTSSSDGEKTIFKSCTEIDLTSKDDKKVDASSKKLLEYADIAASCTKKISNLTAMIEKVRAEKKKMLESSSSSSDKDLTTTSYKELPDKSQIKDASSRQNDLDKLLEIDYSYAERLKQLSKEEIQTEKELAEEKPTDDELLIRLHRLLQDGRKVENEKVVLMSGTKLVHEKDGEPASFVSQKKVVEESKGGKTVGVISEKTTFAVKPTTSDDIKDTFPLFLDIPKLPRLEVSSLDKKKKRPPPSKGLRAIAVVPHELSTIIEADSQLSTKVESPAKSRSGSDLVTEAPHKESATNNSSDDVSEMDTMETMLISIGMEWAIPTLKKTREALALTSSSNGSKESGEISLKEFLSKMASSSSKSELSLNESQGISLIQLDNRKTSTPIVDSEEKKEGPIFLTDSDLSSVKEKSEKDSDDKFYELLEGSSSKTR